MGIKKTFMYRFVVKFIVMVLIPILFLWWIYEKILTFYYAENAVATQQINMENSLELLNATFDTISNVFIALRGNSEIQYYMDYGANKENMFYGDYVDISNFCEELYLMSPYLSNITIYSDNPKIIYSGDPFVKMSYFAPVGEATENLENAVLDEIVWEAILPEKGEDFPFIYGYQKVYTNNYMKCIGYIEIRLSTHLLSDYFELLTNLSDNMDTVLTLYQEENVIYTTAVGQSEKQESVCFIDGMESGYEILYFKNQYNNYLMIPKLDMCIVCSGCLVNSVRELSGNIPSIFISVIILLLLLLFIGFFGDIFSLSRRILDFSAFIRYSHPNHLFPFLPEQKASHKRDEMDILIDTYNDLISDNNSLISQIQKMELFTKEAKYQALQNQVHPHFLYGTLESIRMSALQNEDEETADMIYSLAALTRYSISISEKAVTLQEEVQIVEHYMKIQKIRFDNRIQYSCRVTESLFALKIPPFILQPVLENAIVYGISNCFEPCILSVEAYEEEDSIVIKISNTGLLIQEERLKEVNNLLSGTLLLKEFKGKQNGVALYNIQERLGIYFDGRASVRMGLENGCTVTVITIGNRNGGI